MGLETHPFDIADELHDNEALAIYLDEALQTGDPAYLRMRLARSLMRVA